MFRFIALMIALAAVLTAPQPPAIAASGAPALVQDDGTLKVRNRTYRLYGI